MPVHAGIIELQRKIAFMALLRQHTDNIFFIRGIHDIEGGFLCIPHTETVVMLGCDDHIFHIVFLDHIQPFYRIEFYRVKCIHISLVLTPGSLVTPQLLLMPAAHRIDPPMDEHTESFLAEPVSFVIFRKIHFSFLPIY